MAKSLVSCFFDSRCILLGTIVQKDAAANQCLTIKNDRSCVATHHQKRIGLGLYSIQHVALSGEHGSSDHVGEGQVSYFGSEARLEVQK